MADAARSNAAAPNAERQFLPVNIAVLTVSDTRSLTDDKSGDTLVHRIEGAGHVVAAREIVKDDQAAIVAQLRKWIADENIDVVLATGGTGVTGRDVTPEAFMSVYEKEIPGFGELFRMLSFQEVGGAAMLSRAQMGIARGRIVVSMPGSPNACRLALEKLVLPELGHLVRELSR